MCVRWWQDRARAIARSGMGVAYMSLHTCALPRTPQARSLKPEDPNGVSDPIVYVKVRHLVFPPAVDTTQCHRCRR